MAKVFISYRRTDSATITGRIYDRLVAKFGRKNLFKDVDDIPPGVNFGTYIHDSLQQCRVELVVIGPHWLDARDAQGNRRLDDPDDFVRVEIQTALDLNLVVIPLLVDGAAMPTAADLPESLRPLAVINAIAVRNDPDFAHDMERLIAALERAFASRASGGVFRRRSSAPQAPTSSESPHVNVAALTTTPPANAPTAAPAASSPPASAANAGVSAAKQAQLKGQGVRLSRLSVNRQVAAGLAALLIVLAFGGLLSNQLLGQSQARNSAQTKTAIANASATGDAATSTVAAYAPTATFLALPLVPYFAAAPGPGCDKGRIPWQTTDSSSFSCFSDHTHITDNSSTSVTFRWNPTDSLPQNITYSITVNNGGSGDFSVMLNLVSSSCSSCDYFLEEGGSGPHAYSSLELAGKSYQPVYRGSTNGPHTIALAFSGTTLTGILDGYQVGSNSLTVSQLQELDISSHGVGDISDFRITSP
jgi:hypothetical protein